MTRTGLYGAFSEDKVSEIMGLADFMRPVATVSVGYSAEKAKLPGRHLSAKAITDIE